MRHGRQHLQTTKQAEIRDLLILCQGLVQLRVAPGLAAAVDADHVKLGISDVAEVQTAKDQGGVVDEKAKGARCGGEVEQVEAGQVGGRVAQDQRVGEEVQQRAVLDLDGEGARQKTRSGHGVARSWGQSGKERLTLAWDSGGGGEGAGQSGQQAMDTSWTIPKTDVNLWSGGRAPICTLGGDSCPPHPLVDAAVAALRGEGAVKAFVRDAGIPDKSSKRGPTSRL